LLQALGGVLLIWIAVRLLRPFAGGHSSTREADTMGAAIRTIILADAVMSLDNMLAVGGASKGHIWLLLFGLGMSIPIVLIGGGIVSILIERFPWLSYVGAAVLVHIAIEMIFGDSIVEEFLTVSRRTELLTVAVAVLAVTAFGWVSNRRYQRRNAQSAADAEAEQPARPVSREKVLTHE
jgi:predicted tellurium resistance membrane protein TerC